MGPIYLPVKSLQSVSNTNLFSSDSRCTNTFKKPYLLKLKNKLSSYWCVVCEGPACVRLEGRVGQIYLRSGKYLNKHLVKQSKYKIETQIQIYLRSGKYLNKHLVKQCRYKMGTIALNQIHLRYGK